ncbi:acyl-CoA N-acyltransferase [Stachybotrys elegans]|uniref:Acyl-CoA N-acyltransferase n=1 Tax=Stachybotrys elegans TaxID=80388 RepID=A0A8K0SEV4_9HYPO|nr:acyl-CoA N-acyltransferase [Stachybotrys elegans]
MASCLFDTSSYEPSPASTSATMDLHFRLATQEDADSIQQHIQAAFRAEDPRPNWVGSAELAAKFRMDVEPVLRCISASDSNILMAIDHAGTLVGTVMMSKRAPNSARLAMLAVDQRHSRAGIGRRLLQHAEQHCQNTWDVTRIELDVLSDRPELLEWYLRRGFTKTGAVVPFPEHLKEGLELPNLGCIELEKYL